MGKRKSKSSKQKQTKKKGNSSSLLGKTGAKRKLGSNGIGSINSSTTANKNGDVRISCSLPKPRKSNRQLTEKEDFEQQMNSLYERSQAATSNTKRKSAKRRKNPLEAAAALVMKPASFSLTKSTNQLVEETMHQMGQIMGNSSAAIGNPSTVANNVGTNSLARAAAAIPSSERTPVISNVQHRTYRSTSTSGIQGIAEVGNSASKSSRNSFSALHNDSSEDEDDNSKRIPKARTTPSLNFAPAAFSLESASNSSRFLPTKTPPTTPSSNHHYLRTTHSKRAMSLFGTVHEEELEELHYQQQLEGGTTAAAAAAVVSELHHGLTNLVGGQVDDDL